MSIKTVAILCGGPSAEHEVSLRSALNIAKAISTTKYDLLLLAIDKNGQWFQFTSLQQLEYCAQHGKINDSLTKVNLVVNGKHSYLANQNSSQKISHIDVLFPILHGPFGEDGAIQGLAKLCYIPCVGPGILASALCMDKDVFKDILRSQDIQVSPSITLYKHKQQQINIAEIVEQFGLPLYVKPCNMGSSVGVSKVEHSQHLAAAITEAFRYDQKLLIEKQIIGRELEIAVLGNQRIKTSVIGEVIAGEQFYSYESKYLDNHQATTIIPAQLTAKQQQKITQIAIDSYQAAQLAGLSRVDIFLTEQDQVIVNEINTLPGFTNISMYPQLWQHSDLQPTDLMDELIKLAIQQFSFQKVATDSQAKIDD